MDIAALQSIAQRVNPIAFDVYDRYEQQSFLRDFALVLNNDANENPVKFEWVGANLEARPWVDERTTQAIFTGDFSVPIDDYEATFEFNLREIQRSGSLGASGMAALQTQMQAFSLRKMQILAQVFRDNPPAYDGQDLFDTDHVHPAANGHPQTTYSNVLTPNWADPAAPTLDEADAFLYSASKRLRKIGGYRMEWVDTAQFGSNLNVVTHNESHAEAFETLRDAEHLGTNTQRNRWRGRIRVIEDLNPKAGQENYLEVTHNEGDGPKPVIFVVDQEPGGLEVDESARFDRRKVRMGWSAAYGAKPGWPQKAVQGRPT